MEILGDLVVSKAVHLHRADRPIPEGPMHVDRVDLQRCRDLTVLRQLVV
jgi:hypothetical protein